MVKQICIEWLKASYLDLKNIEKIINDEFLTPIIAFHSQQSVEKSIKALLEYQNKEVPKIHKIQTLTERAELDLKDFEEIIQLLDELYIDSRYPGDMGLLPYGKPTLDDAKEFYKFALEIFDRVCKILDINKQEVMK